jgi:hypothetical protein
MTQPSPRLRRSVLAWGGSCGQPAAALMRLRLEANGSRLSRCEAPPQRAPPARSAEQPAAVAHPRADGSPQSPRRPSLVKTLRTAAPAEERRHSQPPPWKTQRTTTTTQLPTRHRYATQRPRRHGHPRTAPTTPNCIATPQLHTQLSKTRRKYIQPEATAPHIC